MKNVIYQQLKSIPPQRIPPSFPLDAQILSLGRPSLDKGPVFQYGRERKRSRLCHGVQVVQPLPFEAI
jgi:hypothetical protein